MKNRAQTLPVAWLKNGIWALGLAGLYSIILVILRTPQLAHLLSDKSLFKTSLIIHVDLSVLVWLLSIAAVVWSYGARAVYFESIFNKLAFAGMLLMAVSPLLGMNNPVMNNYVPILENIWFIIGLCLFGISLLCFAILVFSSVIARSVATWRSQKTGVMHFFFDGGLAMTNLVLPIVKMTSSLMYIGVWFCFFFSYKQVTYLSTVFPMDLDYYYELLFWSGGHLMQFIYTQIVMFVWLILGEIWAKKKLHYYKIYACLFVINFIVSMMIFYGHAAYQMPDYEFTAFFTDHMKYCGGLAPTLFVIVLGLDIYSSLRGDPLGSTRQSSDSGSTSVLQDHHVAPASFLVMTPKLTFILTSFLTSIFLFFVGGLFGVLISGVNVSIPAHYHGSIVGISIAFLGFAYVFCFGTSLREGPLGPTRQSQEVGVMHVIYHEIATPPTEARNDLTLANIQLYIITIGQLLHISGLALSGGYGVLRKNPDDIIPTSAKIYMGMMGGGGLIAIIGGLMFVYICAKRMYRLKLTNN
jgi:hypothetical protein